MKLGLDLSEHNGNIDFNKIKNAGIEFVILRVGWIGNLENHTIDKKFEEYYREAKAVGLQIGFYVYSYVISESAMLSAIKWVKTQITGKTSEYPIFIDVEDSQISNLSKEQLTNLCKYFCYNFQNSGVYANLDWFKNKLNVNELLNYKIWLAQWTSSENHSADFKVDLWQYSSKGNVNGISGNVDMNKCLNCPVNAQEITGETNKGGDFEVAKKWKNGSTNEEVFADVNLTTKIGTIFPRGEAECLQIVDGKYLVCYNVYNNNNIVNKKTGFVKYNGGL